MTYIDPLKTHAVVVGIETYQAGKAWDLDGAAADAVGIARWLCASHVPPGQVALIVAALASNKQRIAEEAAALGVDLRVSARRDDIMTFFRDEVATVGGAHLVVYWSGHGVLGDADDRIVFTADATKDDPRNIQVNDLLVFLKDKMICGMHQQVVLVDTCANFIEGLKGTGMLGHADFPKTKRRNGVDQFVFYAAGQGQIAKQRSGHFTEALLRVLNGPEGPQWPPITETFIANVITHFKALSAQGVTRQTPVWYWYQDWIGNQKEGRFGGLPVSGRIQQVIADAGLTVAQLWRMAAALEKCAILFDPGERVELRARLGSDVVGEKVMADHAERLFAAAVGRGKADLLIESLTDLARTEDEQMAAMHVAHRWLLQQQIAAPLRHFKKVNTQALLNYFDVVPDRQRTPTLSELDEVLEYLADLDGTGRTAPLLRFVARLGIILDSPMANEWYEKYYKLGPLELSALIETERGAVDARRRSHLVVDLHHPRDPGVALVGHLRGPDGEWEQRSIEIDGSVANAQQALSLLLDWATERTATAFGIGFLVPRAQIDDSPESWLYGDKMTGTTPIREEYIAVLHSGDRLGHARPKAMWESSCLRIAKSLEANRPTVVWINNKNADPKTIRRRVEDEAACCVSFRFVPGPLAGSLADDPLVAAIAAGAPYLIWLDDEPPDWDEMHGVITQLIQQGDFDEIPVRVLAMRRHQPGLGAPIRLLWDRPEWLPPVGILTGMTARTR